MEITTELSVPGPAVGALEGLVPPGLPACALVDLAALADNVGVVRERAGAAQLMAVVKADGYGHGMVPVAQTALAAGATWLGVAQLAEALTLRAAGVEAPVLAWLTVPGDRFAEAVSAGVDVGAGAGWVLDELAAAARVTGRAARVQLKADTGLGRGGAPGADWPELIEHAVRLQSEGVLRVTGLFSHLACADAPGDPSVAGQLRGFTEAVSLARARGVAPELVHLANSAGLLAVPGARFDAVRPGISLYGLSPMPGLHSARELGLRPAMTLVGRLALVKDVPAGQGVSYGLTYRTPRATTVGLVPLGYGDGVPRAASNAGPVLVAGRRRQVAGRVCMDQLVVDLDGDRPVAGDLAVLFGPGRHGEPTAQDWAVAAETISYEIVTRIGARVPRVYLPVHRAGPTSQEVR
jgi:alanine racemase